MWREDWCTSYLQEKKFQVSRFIIQGGSEIDKDVTHHIELGGSNWGLHSISCVIELCHQVKSKFYKVVIRSIMSYGTWCWSVKNSLLEYALNFLLLYLNLIIIVFYSRKKLLVQLLLLLFLQKNSTIVYHFLVGKVLNFYK